MAKKVPTESGNPYHNEGNGQFTSPNDSVDKERYNTEDMSGQELENHIKDRDYNIPHFEKKFMPFFQQLLFEKGMRCFSIDSTEEDFLFKNMSKESRKYYDMQGIDYLLLPSTKIGKGMYSVDLKTISPFNGGKANIITLPIETFDSKVDNKKTNQKGAYTNGWFTRNNQTQLLVFQRLVDESSKELPDCFMVSKENLRDEVQNRFFSDFGNSFSDSMSRLKTEFRNAKDIILKKGELQDKSFKIKYDKNDPNRINSISRFYFDKTGQRLKVVMKFRYEEDKVRHDFNILYPSDLIRGMEYCQYIEKNEYTKNMVDKLFGMVNKYGSNN